jgi:hypothetical protein
MVGLLFEMVEVEQCRLGKNSHWPQYLLLEDKPYAVYLLGNAWIAHLHVG